MESTRIRDEQNIQRDRFRSAVIPQYSKLSCIELEMERVSTIQELSLEIRKTKEESNPDVKENHFIRVLELAQCEAEFQILINPNLSKRVDEFIYRRICDFPKK